MLFHWLFWRFFQHTLGYNLAGMPQYLIITIQYYYMIALVIFDLAWLFQRVDCNYEPVSCTASFSKSSSRLIVVYLTTAMQRRPSGHSSKTRFIYKSNSAFRQWHIVCHHNKMIINPIHSLSWLLVLCCFLFPSLLHSLILLSEGTFWLKEGRFFLKKKRV